MTGIYAIRNKVNNRLYVGQSVDISARLSTHLLELRHGNHHNQHLQRAYNLYGEDKFESTVLEECSIDSLNEREMFWIKNFQGPNSSTLYNITAGGDGTVGMTQSEETKRKISDSETGKIVTEETRTLMSKSKKNPPESTRIKMRNSHIGKTLSEETKKKISDSLSGKSKKRTVPVSAETRRKLSEAGKNRHWSDEDKKKISESVRKAKQQKKLKKECNL